MRDGISKTLRARAKSKRVFVLSIASSYLTGPFEASRVLIASSTSVKKSICVFLALPLSPIILVCEFAWAPRTL